MKRFVMLMLLCVLILSTTALAEGTIDVDLTILTGNELNELQRTMSRISP